MVRVSVCVFVWLCYTTTHRLLHYFFFFLCCFCTFACPAVAMVVITRAMIRKVDVRNRVRLRDYLSICVGYKAIEW